ncbi:MAG: tRNA dihydrouridine synthase DusB [Clostridia bacterium]
MKIGNIQIKNGLFFAPMAGVSDYAFRSICRDYGAECTVSEMISSKAICFNDKKTARIADISNDQFPTAIQLFGNEPYTLASAAKLLLSQKPAFFDINMGCPMPKIVSCGDGSALMKTPEKCGELVCAMRSAVDVPITVKIRSGFTNDCINAAIVAKECEKNGASAVFVHGRTRTQLYSGKADLEVISSVKRAVNIPVIANGDIYSAADALNMFKKTGCDGIMIARGALGRPWIFLEILAALNECEYKLPTDYEIATTIKRQTEMLIEFKGDRALVEMRKHLAWYTKGREGSAAVRREINSALTKQQFFDIIDKIFVERK